MIDGTLALASDVLKRPAQGATVSADGAVALGQGSVADETNTVSVGSVGNERRITNLAAATGANDAANWGQVQAGNAATLTAAISYTNTKFNALSDSFDLFQSDVG